MESSPQQSGAREGRVGKRLAKTLRRRRLLSAVESGLTVEAAAAQEGIGRKAATAILKAAMQELARQNAELAEHVRDLEVTRLDRMQAELWPLLEVKGARVMCETCGKLGENVEAIEHSTECLCGPYLFIGPEANLAAYDRVLKISERRSKLLGLDAPSRVNVSGSVDVNHGLVDDAERERLERAWRDSDQIEGEAVEELPVGD